jgi:hypothetical protein
MNEQELLMYLCDLVDTLDNEKLAELIPFAALQLKAEQVQTVSFAFWLTYMAEKDLNDVMVSAWQSSMQITDTVLAKAVKDLLQVGIRGEKEIDPENMEYFIDKIKVYESFYGKDNRTKLFYKLNDIRNDISHNRIDELTYNNASLYEVETKRLLLKKYFETVTEEKDWTQSNVYKTLTQEERVLVETTLLSKLQNILCRIHIICKSIETKTYFKF